MASLFDIIPQKYHASGAGIMLSFAFVFGSTSPVILGVLKERFASSTGLATLAVVYLVGAAVIAIARMRQYGTHGTARTDGTQPPSQLSR